MEKEGKKWEGSCGAIIYRDGKPYGVCGSANCQTHGKSPLPQKEPVQEPHNFVQSQGASKISGGSLPNHDPANDGNGGWEERFREKFQNPNTFDSSTPLNPKYMNGKIGHMLNDMEVFIASEIRLAEERLVKRILKEAMSVQTKKENFKAVRVSQIESIVSIAKGEAK